MVIGNKEYANISFKDTVLYSESISTLTLNFSFAFKKIFFVKITENIAKYLICKHLSADYKTLQQ